MVTLTSTARAKRGVRGLQFPNQVDQQSLGCFGINSRCPAMQRLCLLNSPVLALIFLLAKKILDRPILFVIRDELTNFADY